MKNLNNMKKSIIILLLAAMIFPACNDLLDLRTNGTITMDEVFTDANRTRGYLNACYQYLPGTNVNVGSFTDDAVNSAEVNAGSSYDYWYNSGLTASNFASYNWEGSVWAHYFQAIRKCNVFINNIDNATADITTNERTGWKAQAQVLRAFYYLQLMKRYGQVPLILEDLGTTHDYSGDTRATVGAVATQILADCDAAIATSESDDFAWAAISNQWNIMTKAIAYAIKSETMVFAVSPLLDDGTFTKDQALEVVATSLKQLLDHDYSLWTQSSSDYNAYASYFLYNPNDLRSSDKETIFGGARVAVWSSCGLPIVSGQTSAGSCPTQDLVDAYEMANGEVAITGYSDANHLQPIINSASGYNESKPYVGRDPRFYATVFYHGSKRGNDEINVAAGGNCATNPTSTRYTHTGYYMRKYAANNSNRNSNADGYMRVMRLPEMYYNFAEIAYQVNGPDATVSAAGMSARDAVNAVRNRAGMPDLPTGLSASEFEARYRNDRRVEYALEADHFFCLRRWKTLDQTKFVTGATVNSDGTITRFRFPDRPTTESKYLLYPIDQLEENKTATLTGTGWQNPGW